MTQIIRAQHMGFCFGVRDAVAAAHATPEPQQTAVYGELVHNTDVMDSLRQRDIQLLDETARDEVPQRPIVMVTAHGISDRRRTMLQSQGKQLIDTTCPLVRRVHQAAAGLIDRKHFVVIIGNRDHVEVQGIVEDLPEADCAVVADPTEVIRYPNTHIGIISQTTIPAELATRCRVAIADANPQATLRWINTICRPTRQRQTAVDQLCHESDVVIVVGGKNSNNTRRLWQRCLDHNVPAHHVQSAADLQPEWLVDHQGIGQLRIGLTAGTSTPDATIDAVEQRLRELVDHNRHRMQTGSTWCHDWNNRQWAEHFQDNMANPPTISWSDSPTLTEQEKTAVIDSIRTFQLGESGEGKHICKAAANWIQCGGDPDYLPALRLFLQEENCHAAWLGKFLKQEDASLLEDHWSDHCFRGIRHCAGLRTSINVLLTAEILAQVYYLALMRSTQSKTLREICRRILRDERAHVVFQQNQSNEIARRWGWLRRRAIGLLETIGFRIARSIVWHDHYSVFKAANMDWNTYRDRTMRRWLAARR
ncbi:MAG: 4-hydroxy-3-methylbut-2-enyl diphosphate reductase [Pirellulaceae bacterium]